jgi:hypothetical protein
VAPDLVGCMVLTFYVGEAAAAFKQYAAYVQRRTATHIAQIGTASAEWVPLLQAGGNLARP